LKQMESLPGDIKLIMLLAAAVIALLIFAPSSVLAMPAAIVLPFVLGYATVSALFPSKYDLGGRERALFTFGTGLALILAERGLIYAGMEALQYPLQGILALLAIALSATAYARRRTLPRSIMFAPGIPIIDSIGRSKAVLHALHYHPSRKALLFVLLACSIAAMAFLALDREISPLQVADETRSPNDTIITIMSSPAASSPSGAPAKAKAPEIEISSDERSATSTISNAAQSANPTPKAARPIASSSSSSAAGPVEEESTASAFAVAGSAKGGSTQSSVSSTETLSASIEAQTPTSAEAEPTTTDEGIITAETPASDAAEAKTASVVAVASETTDPQTQEAAATEPEGQLSDQQSIWDAGYDLDRDEATTTGVGEIPFWQTAIIAIQEGLSGVASSKPASEGEELEPNDREVIAPNEPATMRSLVPDPASPQVAGTKVNWTAYADDPDDKIEYRFLLDGRETRGWSRSPSWIWDTSGSTGNHRIEADARDGMHDGEFDDSTEASFSITEPNEPPKIISLKPNLASPQAPGAKVFWAAFASDPEDKIFYRFLLDGRIATNWSRFGSWTWDTTGQSGEHQIAVHVKDGLHDEYDSEMGANFSLVASNSPPEINALTPDLPSPQETGSAIKWTVYASDAADPIEFRFHVDGTPATDWTRSNSWTWRTDGLSGEHRITVQARDGLHDEYDSEMGADFSLVASNSPPEINALTPDLPSPQEAGSAIKWTVYASDAADPIEFRFLADGTPATDWTRSNSWTWRTDGLSGEHRITVQARDALHDEYDSEMGANFSLVASNSPPEINALTPDLPSPQEAGSAIKWTVYASDAADPIEFRFLADGTLATDWTRSNSWTWRTDGLSGEHRITVQARDERHEEVDSEMGANFELIPASTPVSIQSLISDNVSPQAPGVRVTWTASPSDPEALLLYRFLLDGLPMTVWSGSPEWAWDTAKAAPGEHIVSVQAKDLLRSTGGIYDCALNATYKIAVANIPPVLERLASDPASPEIEGTRINWRADAFDSEDEVAYRFLLDGRAMTEWSASPVWAWETTGFAGEHRVTVQARDGMHEEVDDSIDADFSIDEPNLPPVLESLASDLASPEVAGARVTWTATAIDPEDEIAYKFLIDGRPMTGWSASSQWVWDTAGAAPGEHRITVQARDERHEEVDSALDSTFAISSLVDQEIERAMQGNGRASIGSGSQDSSNLQLANENGTAQAVLGRGSKVGDGSTGYVKLGR